MNPCTHIIERTAAHWPLLLVTVSTPYVKTNPAPCVNCKSILYFLEHEWMPPSPGWCGWSVVTFLSTLVNTQPAAGESWTDKIYVKPVAFLVLWWFSMVLGASKIGSFLHIVLANSCPFLQIFLCTTKSVTLCFLNFVFLFSGSIFWPMFYIRIATEQSPHRRMHGGEIVNIAPLLSQPLSILSLLSPQHQFGQLSAICAAVALCMLITKSSTSSLLKPCEIRNGDEKRHWVGCHAFATCCSRTMAKYHPGEKWWRGEGWALLLGRKTNTNQNIIMQFWIV